MATSLQVPAPKVSAAERRTIPFDYAFRYKLTGIRDTVQNATITVSIEATFVAVSIGYGFIPDLTAVSLTPQTDDVKATQGTLRFFIPSLLKGISTAFTEPIDSSGRIGPKTANALRTGVRLDPRLVEFAVTAGVNQVFKDDIWNGFFQVAPPPRDVQFLYAIFDEGTGREFQNEPILNTAGLGISDGERPFRYFARPIEFLPRSTIRMQVTEKSEVAGWLHVSLQGYKVLGGAGTPTGKGLQRSRRGSR